MAAKKKPTTKRIARAAAKVGAKVASLGLYRGARRFEKAADTVQKVERMRGESESAFVREHGDGIAGMLFTVARIFGIKGATIAVDGEDELTVDEAVHDAGDMLLSLYAARMLANAAMGPATSAAATKPRHKLRRDPAPGEEDKQPGEIIGTCVVCGQGAVFFSGECPGAPKVEPL
jgi:hypothetical protein